MFEARVTNVALVRKVALIAILCGLACVAAAVLFFLSVLVLMLSNVIPSGYQPIFGFALFAVGAWLALPAMIVLLASTLFD